MDQRFREHVDALRPLLEKLRKMKAVKISNRRAETLLTEGSIFYRKAASTSTKSCANTARPECSAPPSRSSLIDDVQYASGLSWHCLAAPSIEARARHISSILAKIDRQLEQAPFAAAHIGMYAERDALSADRRRARNIEAARRFDAKSNLTDVYLHYFVLRVSESSCWAIDETADAGGCLGTPLLGDYRMLTPPKPHGTSHRHLGAEAILVDHIRLRRRAGVGPATAANDFTWLLILKRHRPESRAVSAHRARPSQRGKGAGGSGDETWLRFPARGSVGKRGPADAAAIRRADAKTRWRFEASATSINAEAFWEQKSSE